MRCNRGGGQHRSSPVSRGAIIIATLLRWSPRHRSPILFTRPHIIEFALYDSSTIYFASPRNPSTDSPCILGLLQTSQRPTVPLGSTHRETIIGYLGFLHRARWTRTPAARFALTAAFFVTHQACWFLRGAFLWHSTGTCFTSTLFVAALVNALVAVFPFHSARRPAELALRRTLVRYWIADGVRRCLLGREKLY